MATKYGDVNLPDNPRAWVRLIVENGLEDESIHDGNYLTSGSEASLPQCLLLRILWKKRLSSPELLAWPSAKSSEKATQLLNRSNYQVDNEWVNYLKSIERGWTRYNSEHFSSLGRYALVRQYQCAVQDMPHDDDESDESEDRGRSHGARTPPSSGVGDGGRSSTPARTAAQMVLTNRTRQPPPQTPQRPPNAFYLSETPGTGATASTSWSPLAQGSLPLTSAEARAQGSEQDEQIVNTALILFLDTLTVHHNDLVRGQWSHQRFAFEFRCIKRGAATGHTFKALVDGHLYQYFPKPSKRTYEHDAIGRNIQAIVEVKASARHASFSKSNSIKIQEALELACWIQNYPPPEETIEKHRNERTLMRRVLVAQDSSEIYITIAEFSAEYIDFVRGKPYSSVDLGGPFLGLREFGPFRTDRRADMKVFSRHMVAFSLLAVPPKGAA